MMAGTSRSRSERRDIGRPPGNAQRHDPEKGYRFSLATNAERVFAEIMLKPIGHPASRRGSSRRDQACEFVADSNSGRWRLLGLLGRIRRPRDAPWIVFFLGRRNALERGLVGLVV